MKAVFLSLICALTILSCTDTRLHKIESLWYYTTADSPDSDQYQLLNEFQNLEKLINEQSGYIYIKTEFDIDPSIMNGNPAISLGRIITADETYINGHFIGKTGSFPPRFFSSWNETRSYMVPRSLLKQTGNELIIKVFINGEGELIGSRYIGDSTAIRTKTFIDDFFNSYINALIFVIMIIFGFYHFLIYLKRKQDVENLYYALLALSFAIYETNFFIQVLPDPLSVVPSYLFFQKIIFISQYFVAYFLAYFIKTFSKHKSYKLTDILLLVALLAPVIPHLFFFDYGAFRNFTRLVQPLILLPIIYIIFVLLYSIKKKKKEPLYLLIGVTPLLVFVLLDVFLHQVLKMADLVYLSGVGFPAFMIAVLFIMANKFVNYHNEFERMNIKLEKKNDELKLLYNASL